MTRREMNRALLLGLAAFSTVSQEAILKAATFPAESSFEPSESVTGNRIAAKTLMEEPLASMPKAEVSIVTLTVSPGATSPPHRHIGPVFAYVLEGRIENQVDPHKPQTYTTGQFFYEPPMHIHRILRNLSKTRPAKLLIFQVGERGKKFTISAK